MVYHTKDNVVDEKVLAAKDAKNKVVDEKALASDDDDVADAKVIAAAAAADDDDVSDSKDIAVANAEATRANRRIIFR